jgi:His-Xaa-Ser system radical SAM maturase HxsB
MFQLLPFQFKVFRPGRVLMVNECGDYYFTPAETFEDLMSGNLTEENENYYDLISRSFIRKSGQGDISIEKTAAKYRSRKSFLCDFTSLHMMVVTLRCNQRCEYCQVSCAEQDAHKYDMSPEVARKIVDIIFESPAKYIKIEFQGGEPTLNWDAVQEAVLYAEEKNQAYGKEAEFVLCTNLIAISMSQLEFCRDHKISVSTSLDGPQFLHDGQRISRVGESSYNLFIKKLSLAREVLGYDGVDALMTTTALSLQKMKDVVDEYVARGFNGIFIRSLNPYGYAAEQEARLGYDMHVFVEAYVEALDYIIGLNKEINFQEYFATLLFSRILTPFSTGFVDLQSPAGVGISGAIYDYDGSVYPSDEARMLARMGDDYFKLGNVLTDAHKRIFSGKKLRDIISSSCVEITPGCATCVYQAYCGTDPVRNYLESGDIMRCMEETPFCIKHKGIFEALFSILDGISETDEKIIWNWITPSPARDS